eukprot:TRINITY_DN66061_c3_g1_i1.p1 TRINITY_DN66061_c3_g1~~TRINITY_DN66061_c3_g1_i1.p1  ORF type:complete len:832 (+),score=59.80 TRINITY_DN66061_c3_g1_i1:25-2520(+)
MSLGTALLEEMEDKEMGEESIKYFLRVSQATRALCEDSFSASKFLSFLFLVFYFVVSLLVALGQMNVSDQSWVTRSQFGPYEELSEIQDPEDFWTWLKHDWVDWTFGHYTPEPANASAVCYFGHNKANILVFPPYLETYRLKTTTDGFGQVDDNPKPFGKGGNAPDGTYTPIMNRDAGHPWPYFQYNFHIPGHGIFDTGVLKDGFNIPYKDFPSNVTTLEDIQDNVRTQIRNKITSIEDFVDEHTAMIILNVVTLNRILNIVCAGRWVLEMLPGGSLKLASAGDGYYGSVFTFGGSEQCRRNGFYTTGTDWGRMVGEIIFLVLSVLFFINIIQKEWRLLKAHGSWVSMLGLQNLLITLFDVTIFAIAIFVIGEYLIVCLLQLKKLQDNSVHAFYTKEYTLHSEIAMNTYKNGVGIFLFCLTFRIIRTMTFSERVAILANTLAGAATPLLFFCIVFGIVVGGYAYVGFYYFGPLLTDYKDFTSSAASTLLMATQEEIQYKAMAEVNIGFSAVYYFSFALIVMFILVNIFLAIVMAAYDQISGDSVAKYSHRGTFTCLINPFQNALLKTFEEQEWVARVSRHPVPCQTRVWLRKHKLWITLSLWLYGSKLSTVQYLWICTPGIVRLKDSKPGEDDDDEEEDDLGGDPFSDKLDDLDGGSDDLDGGGGRDGKEGVVLEVFTSQYAPSYQCQLIKRCGIGMKFRLPPELITELQRKKNKGGTFAKWWSTDKLTFILHKVWNDVSPYTNCSVYFTQTTGVNQMVLNLGDAMDFWSYPYVVARDDIALKESLNQIKLADRKYGPFGYSWAEVREYLEDEHSQREELSFFEDASPEGL